MSAGDVPQQQEDNARSAVDRFVQRFQPLEREYRLLVCHAALPLVLTPELLNYLRTRFLHGRVPWVAEADLLLSDLCRPAGYETYTMDPPIRAYLLREMRHDPELGPARMQEVARLLIHYTRHLSRTNPYLDHHELQAQQWAAMVYLDDHRETAAREIAEALRRCVLPQAAGAQMARPSVDRAEMERLSRLTQAMAPGLEAYPVLVEYAQSISWLLASRPETEQLRATELWLGGARVLGVNLPPLNRLTEAGASESAPSASTRAENWFFDREDALSAILSSSTPPYLLVHAPPGYGKTALLREAQKGFGAQSWLCAYVSLAETRSLSGMAGALAFQLGIHLSSTHAARELGVALGTAVLRQIPAKVRPSGVALLIDDIHEEHTAESSNMHRALFEDFVPGIYEALALFKWGTPNFLRVIAAGRAVPQAIGSSPISWRILRLTPFTFQVVQEMVRTHLPGLEPRHSLQFAADLMYYAAGHARALVSILSRYQEQDSPPDQFFLLNAERIWKDILLPCADAIGAEVDPQLLGPLDTLSVFRGVDAGVLRELVRQHWIDWRGGEEALADRLVGSYLMDRDARFLMAGMVPSLLASRLKYRDPDRFSGLCELAQQICRARLADSSTRAPERWVLELLFQYLQQHGPFTQPYERIRVSDRFFELQVPSALDLLCQGRHPAQQLAALGQALAGDSSLTFAVNYYLRKDKYDDAPLTRLGELIARYLPEGIRMDKDGRLRLNGRYISGLTRLEYALLLLLYERGSAGCDRLQIAEALWPEERSEANDNRIDSLVRRLRAKIEPDPSRPRYLETIRGWGYRLSPLGRRDLRHEAVPQEGQRSGVRVDVDSSRVWVDGHEVTAHLTTLEYRVLRALCDRLDQVVDKDQLVLDVWGEESLDSVTDDAIAKLLARLRQRLDDLSPHASRYLITVRGQGYKLITP